MPVFRLSGDPLLFPSADLAEPGGLLCLGGNLSSERIIAAYRQGIFPWYSRGEPILWWSPDPRFVLFPEELKVSDSMRRLLKQGAFEITFDKAFRDVIHECRIRKRPGQKGTWITLEMQAAYCRLHEEGVAHSVEAWNGNRLAGGLYGLKMGKMFFGESMFYRESNASKACFMTLVEKLKQEGCRLIDCQVETKHLASLGARAIPRREYLKLLRSWCPAGSPPISPKRAARLKRSTWRHWARGRSRGKNI